MKYLLNHLHLLMNYFILNYNFNNSILKHFIILKFLKQILSFLKTKILKSSVDVYKEIFND